MIYDIDVYYDILCIDVVSAALPNLTSHVVLLLLWQVDSCMKQLLELQQQKDVLPRLVAGWLCKRTARKATRNVSLWVSWVHGHPMSCHSYIYCLGMEKPWKKTLEKPGKTMVLATLNMLGMMITLMGQALGVAQNVLTTSMATWLGNLFCEHVQVDRTW